MRGSPDLPFFVVMMITPLADCAPYCAAALASLSTWMLSTSSGFRLGFWRVYIPSTTYSGEVPPRKFCPRTITWLCWPGSPVDCTVTPAMRPRSASSSVPTCWSSICSALTSATASLTVARRCVV
jgi:hypothetical protein